MFWRIEGICATLILGNFMELIQEHKQQIEKIISEMECPKDFVCLTPGFESLSKTRLIASDKLVECMDENSHLCKFVLVFGRLPLCTCPLRNYIVKNPLRRKTLHTFTPKAECDDT